MMRLRGRPLASVLLLLAAPALGALQACQRGPETAGGERFSGALADSLVDRQLVFGPRVPGTEAHAEALAWLTGYLGARADSVETIAFTHVTTRGDTVALTNVFARFRPAEPARILLVAHWDSRPVAENSADPAERRQPVPGANDGASGVAVLLALADLFSREPPPVGIDVLLTDGEDWGYDPETLDTLSEDMLLGARHFARTRGADYRPLYGILLDMVGDQNPSFPRDGISLQFAPEVVSRVWAVAEELGYGDVFVDRIGGATDDHLPLNEAGIRTIDVIDLDYPWWHTTEDTADKISAETLGIVGEVVLEVIRRQGGGS